MNVRILNQPFDARGVLSRLGIELTQELAAVGSYNEVYICSAFVTSSGTQRVRAAFQGMIQAGGRVQAIIGVNNGLTSIQAVTDLIGIGVNVVGFHTGGSVLYHPKVYLLRGLNQAWVSVGSSNLTGDGMYRNIEINTIIELNLRSGRDARVANEFTDWLNSFRNAYRRNSITLNAGSANELLQSGALIDETSVARTARIQQQGSARAVHRITAGIPPPLRVPPLPPVSGQPPVRRRPRRGMPVRVEPSAPVPTPQTRFFAMTLSAHDSSKRTGMPGTPELSLPRAATGYFPPMTMTRREFPDAYFDVHLNSGDDTRVVTYRIWERPAGGATGHADLRINIKHDTVDLTTPGGGDIVLFEVAPSGSGPAYDVWIIRPQDPNYNATLQRCMHNVTTRGAAEVKRFGFF